MEDLKKYMNVRFGSNATGFVFDNIDKFCDEVWMLTIEEFRRIKAEYFKDTNPAFIPSSTIIYRAFDFYCEKNDIFFNKRLMQTRNKKSTRYVAFDRNKK